MSSRNERLAMRSERYTYYGTPGNLANLIDEITKVCNLEYVAIVKMLPGWLNMLTEKQSCVLRLFYFKQMSIYEIRYHLGANSNNDVDRCLQGAKKKILKISKEFNKTEEGIG